ncbi:MAG: Ig-like domain-containing protein [Lachnospiraceae bacterium]|nr:Ig-like domain-containing protein [Lachnospiraceae bacterium]
MLKRKLLKQALPILLSAAMIFQSMPATALAAERTETTEAVKGEESSQNGQQGTDQEEAADQDKTPSDSGSQNRSQVEGSSQDNAQSEEPIADNSSPEKLQPEDGNYGGDKQESENPDNTQTDNRQDKENADQENPDTTQTDNRQDKEELDNTQTDDKQESENPDKTQTDKEQTDNQQESENPDTAQTDNLQSESVQPDNISETETATDGEVSENNAGENKLLTELVIDENLLRDVVNNISNPDRERFKYNEENNSIETTYLEEAQEGIDDIFAPVIQNLKTSPNSSQGITIKVDGAPINALRDKLDYKWRRQKADGSGYEDIDKAPVNAGSYQLIFFLEKEEGLCQAAQAEPITLVIQPKELKVDLKLNANGKKEVAPGTTLKAFKEDLIAEFALASKDDKEYKDIFVETPVITVKVADKKFDDPESKPLEGEDVLFLNGTDYCMTFQAALKAEKKNNYVLKMDFNIVDIVVSDCTKTTVLVTNNALAEGKEISTVYADKAISFKELVAPHITAKVVEAGSEEDLEKTPIEDKLENLEPVWLIYDGTDDNGEAQYIQQVYDEQSPDVGPKDAGTYYIGLKYAGKEGVYQPSQSEGKNLVKVIIEPVMLTMQPKFDTGKETFPEGTEESEVLSALKYTLLDKDGKEPTDLNTDSNKEIMWGISYYSPDTTQYFEPLFKLQYAQTDKDGKVTYIDNQGAVLDAKKTYRIVFTGKKGVYSFRSDKNSIKPVDEADINDTSTQGANPNYNIDVKETVLAQHTAEVKVTEAAATTINVKEIVGDKGNSYENAYTRIYSGSPIFADRKDYKKAVVLDADGKEISDAKYDADTLTYTWYRLSNWDIEEDEEGNPVYDTKGDEIKIPTEWTEADFDKVSKPDENICSPTELGDYMLKISYKDPNHKNRPAEAEVFIRIEEQLVKAMPAMDFKAWTTTKISDYLKEIKASDNAYRLYKIPDNDEAKFNAEFALWTEEQRAQNELTDWKENSDYKIRWSVERADNDDAGKIIPDSYEEIAYIDSNSDYVADIYSTFLSDYKDNYRITLSVSDISKHGYAYIKDDIYGNDGKPLETPVKHNEIKPITVEVMGDIELELAVDKAALGDAKKPYDGKPFDIEAAKQKGLVTIKDKQTGRVLTAEELKEIALEYIFYDSGSAPEYSNNNAKRNLTQAVNAGKYTLKVSFAGNTKYRSIPSTEIAEIEITPLSVTIAPKLNENVKAGSSVSALYNGAEIVVNLEELPDKKLPEGEEHIFTLVENQVYDKGTNQDGSNRTGVWSGYPVLWDESEHLNEDQSTAFFSADVYKKGETTSYHGFLRGGVTYQVQYNNNNNKFVYPYNRNYKVTYTKEEYIVTLRDKAEVSPYPNNNMQVAFRDIDNSTETELKHTIIPRESIPFTKERSWRVQDGNETLAKSGNFFAFRIQAPKEFQEDKDSYNDYFGKFTYKNAIMDSEVGGYILSTDSYKGYIDVVFDASAVKASSTTARTFQIRWEDGFTEQFTVDLSEALLDEDLEKAVAPKALKFNGANTKMVVGETQQLDVKITKAQLSDVICLGYKVENGSDVISVTDTGFITALSAGTATITVYAARMVNGEKKDFSELGLAGKTASIKFTVSDVAKPAIKKVTPYDDNVSIEYTKVPSGYRREIYVIEGNKNAKEDEFETKISEIKKGRWEGIFAMAPIYISEEDWSKTNTYTLNTENYGRLKTGTDYTVYVRNVSGIRRLADGTQVAASHAGTVKGFTTTKAQARDLEVYFETENTPVEYIKQYQNGYVRHSYYSVALTEKKATVSVNGIFREKPQNNSAEYGDEVKMPLPVTDSNYMNPKISYYVSSNNEFGWDAKGKPKFAPTKIASIDKKGNLKLKGAGTVYVFAVDENGHIDYAELDITATPDSITGKKAKLQIGETVDLYTLLQYKAGRTKLPDYELGLYHDVKLHKIAVPQLTIDMEDLSSKGYRVEENTDSRGYQHLYVTPLGNASNADISVSAEGISSPATIKLQVKAIDPVKNLKQEYIDDNNVLISFKHTGNLQFGDGFNIEVRDARGTLINNGNRFVSNKECVEIESDEAEWYDRLQNYEHDTLYYFTGTQTYKYLIGGLVMKSSYSVSVTAVSEGTAAKKAAVKKIKTTNIPAYRLFNLLKDDISSEWDDHESMRVSVSNRRDISEENGSYTLGNCGYLMSGNTYTLTATGADRAARSRVTDTLSWKSTNTKVATVKANAGSYTATLKAVKNGTTNIEVTSKITKKVIARWTVYIKAVGEAAPDYAGEYDPTAAPFIWDPTYTAGVEVLTLTNPVSVQQQEMNDNLRTWAKFTAPAFGRYTFCAEGGSIRLYTQTEKNAAQKGSGSSQISDKLLKAGQTVYLKISGNGVTVTAEGTTFATLQKGTPVKVDFQADAAYKTEYICFTAPSKNYYTFWAEDAEGRYRAVSAETEEGKHVSLTPIGSENGTKYGKGMEAGETIYLKVSGSNQLLTVSVTDREILSSGKLNKDVKEVSAEVTKENEVWLSFTAPATAKYTFTAQSAEEFKLAYYASILDDSAVAHFDITEEPKLDADGKPVSDGSKIFTGKYLDVTVKEGETILLKLTTEKEKAAVKVSVSLPQTEVLILGEEKSLTVTEQNPVWLSYKVTESGRYNIKAIAKDAAKQNTIQEVKVYKEDLATSVSLTENHTLIVMDNGGRDNGSVQVGDTIYLRVAVDESETETKNAIALAVSITKTALKALALGETETSFTNNSEAWYTFTAKETGLYIFQSQVTQNKEKGTHTITAKRYQTEFDSYGSDFGNSANATSSYDFYNEVRMNAGEKVMLRVTADSITSADNTAVTTAAKISVSKVTPTALTTQAPAAITLAKNNEANWYLFTALQDAVYTFAAKKVKDDSGEARILYRDDLGGLSSSYNSFEIGSTIRLTMKKGDTYYFKAVQVGDTAVNAQLSVSTPTVEKTTGQIKAELTKEQNEKWYSFTAALTDIYTFTKNISEADTEAKIEIYESMTSDYPMNTMGESESRYEIWLTVGRTYYLKVSTEAQKATVNITVTARSEEAAANVVTLEKPKDIAVKLTKENWDYQYTWCSFTAPKAGQYSFAVEWDEKVPVYGYFGYAYEVTKDGNRVNYNNYSNNGKGVTLKQGQEYVIYVYSCYSNVEGVTAESSVRLKVSEVTPEELKTPADISLKAKDIKYYTYTAKETGYYTLNIKSKEDTYLYLQSTGYYINGEYKGSASVEDTTQTLQVRLEQGDKILFVMEAYADTSFTVDMSVNAEIALESQAAKEVTIEPGQQKHFRFYALNEGLFTFRSADLAKANIAVSNCSRTYQDQYGNNREESLSPLYNKGADGLYFVLKNTNERSTIYFTVTNYGDAKITFKAAAERVVPEELTQESSVSANIVRNELKWLTFKAPENGRYTLKSDNDKIAVKQYNGSNLVTANPTAGYALRKDEVITFAVSYTGDEASAAVKISMAPFESEKLETGKTATVTVKKGETIWYQFTAEKRNYYAFAAKPLKEGEVLPEIQTVFYTGSNNAPIYNGTLSEVIDRMDDRYMEEGSSVLFGFTNPSETDDASFTLSVESRETVLALNKAETITIPSGGSAFVEFTLPDNGIYAIKTLDETIGTRLDVQYYGGTGNCSDLGMRSSYNGFYAAIAGDKDSSRSLRIRDYNNTGEDVTITVIAEPVRKQTLTLNENGEITRQVPMNNYEFQWFSITPNESGRYTINAFDTNAEDEDAYVEKCHVSHYYDSEEENWYYDYYDISAITYMPSGDEFLFYVKAYNENANVQITIKPFAPQVLRGEVNETFSLNASRGKWYEYQVEEDGFYTFNLTSDSGEDEEMYLTRNPEYEEERREGRAYGSNVSMMLTAGTSMYIRVSNWHDDEDSIINYTLTVRKQTLKQVYSETVNFATYGEQHWLEFTADTTGNYRIIGSTNPSRDDADFWMEYYDSKSDPAPSEQDGIRKANVYSGTTPYALTSKNIPAGETKYIKLYPYYANNHGAQEAMGESINITIYLLED